MTSRFEILKQQLRSEPRKWLVTGVAGFIGSNLLQTLLEFDQEVVGLDNFSTGKVSNLEQVKALVGTRPWARFRFVEGDIVNLDVCKSACAGVHYVLHQAALGSVPRSMEDPVSSHQSNVTGFLNMLVAARDAKCRRFVYASSSAVYGDEPGLPKLESKTGKPLSPYAATKVMNEVYANAFAQAYGVQSIGLRYFNVFGPRQDPDGAYAAVIPKWIASMIRAEPVFINGDGETSRDFCFINNVVQANLLAATAEEQAANQAYNIAVGERTTLNQLFQALRAELSRTEKHVAGQTPVYRDFRAGDVRHSLADISKAQSLLGYAPTHRVDQGISLAMDWYRTNIV
jgi:UDP-N-acetylglucosamine 4-epimerase